MEEPAALEISLPRIFPEGESPDVLEVLVAIDDRVRQVLVQGVETRLRRGDAIGRRRVRGEPVGELSSPDAASTRSSV